MRTFDCTPDRRDSRDFLFSQSFAPTRSGVRILDDVDLRYWASPVEDQEHLGACTANALVGDLEFLDVRDTGTYVDLSRLFLYRGIRDEMGMVESDSGGCLRDGIKVLNKLGVCSESAWPYAIDRFRDKPTTFCYEQALTRRIKAYHRLVTLDDVLLCLSSGHPFVFGFSVYDSFASTAVYASGVLDMPKSGERFLGRHAVLAMGYSLRSRRLLVRNSWGTGFGMAGYFTMPFSYLCESCLASDLWCIEK